MGEKSGSCFVSQCSGSPERVGPPSGQGVETSFRFREHAGKVLVNWARWRSLESARIKIARLGVCSADPSKAHDFLRT